MPILLCISCAERQKSERLLKKAQSIIFDKPDSALFLLDSIPFPESLDKAQYFSYIVSRVQAKYKSNKSIVGDTLIFRASDYFQRVGDNRQKASAAMYAGIVCVEMQESDRALRFLELGELYAEKIPDYDMMGLINSEKANLYYSDMYHTDALACFKESLRCFTISTKNMSKEVKAERLYAVNLGIALCFTLMNNPDSASLYYGKTLETIQSLDDTSRISPNMLSSMALSYCELGDDLAAKKCWLRAYQTERDTLEQVRLIISLIGCYNNLGMRDSSEYFHAKLIEQMDAIKDTTLISVIYKHLYEYAYTQGDVNKALEYCRKYSDMTISIYEKNLTKTLLETKKESSLDKLKLQHKDSYIKMLWIFIALIIIVVLVVIWGVGLRIKHIRNRIALTEAEGKIQTMNEMVEEIKSNADSELRSILFKRFDVMKKLSLLGAFECYKSMSGASLLREFNKIVYSEEYSDTWSAMYDMINKMTHGIPDKIKEDYGDILDDSEFQLLIYSYAGLSAKETAILLNKQVNTIYNRRTIIRKKIGIEAISETDFINSKYNYNPDKDV